ncbi:MAG: ComEC/Rec2 family competence protein [Elusimicrobiota bacterium]
MKIQDKYTPLFFPLLTVACGIITGRFLPSGAGFIYFTGIITSLLFILWLKYGNSKIILIPLYTFLFLFSWFNFSKATTPGAEDIANLVPFKGQVTGRVLLSTRMQTARIKKIDGKVKEGGVILLNYDGSDLPSGSLVKIRGNFKKPPGKINPGQFDFKKYLKLKGIFTTVQVTEIEKVSISPPGAFLSRIREYISRKLENYFPEEKGKILNGMLLGRPGELSDLRRQKFRDAGISHILAVSGLHVGLVLYAVYYILTAFKFRTNFAMAISLLAMGVYIFVTGARPSALRAGFMLSLLFLGDLWGGRGNPMNCLFLAGMILLLVNPGQLFTAGFLLSFLAVWGILYLTPVLERVPYLPVYFCVSLAAILGILPVIAWNFYYLPLLAPLINLFVVPLAGIIVNLGLFFLAISGISSFLGEIYAVSISYVVGILEYLTDIVYELGIGGVDYPRPLFTGIIGYYVFLIFLGVRQRRIKKIGLFTGLLLFIPSAVQNHRPDNYLAAIKSYNNISYIISKEGETIFLKGKGEIVFERVDNFLKFSGTKKIEDIYVIHPVFKEPGQLAELANSYKAENIYYSGVTGFEKGWLDFKDRLSESKIRKVERGKMIDYGAYRVKITEPVLEFADIRDNIVQMEIFDFNRDGNIFVYAGGNLPKKEYSLIIAIDPYRPEWKEIIPYSEKDIIYSGKAPFPPGVVRIKEKGFIEKLNKY